MTTQTDEPSLLDEILAESKPKEPTFRMRVSASKLINLRRLAVLTSLLESNFGIKISPKAQGKMTARLMHGGKNRVYNRRPDIFDPVTGYRETFGDRRKRLIASSQRQGVEVAAKARADYKVRRALRWRGVVERNFVPMFQQAAAELGLGVETGSQPQIKTIIQPRAK